VASDRSTVGGGENNTASNIWATVGGGFENLAGDGGASVGGGLANTRTVTQPDRGGYGNVATNYCATIGGGYLNTANGYYSAVAGGYVTQRANITTQCVGERTTWLQGPTLLSPVATTITANGEWSFAAGRYAQAIMPAPLSGRIPPRRILGTQELIILIAPPVVWSCKPPPAISGRGSAHQHPRVHPQVTLLM